MKTLLFTLSLLAAGFAQAKIFDCSQNEAQFIGTMKNIEKDYLDQNQVRCLFEIEFSHFQPSMICPLDIGAALAVKHEAESCDVKAGDEVSGVLVEKAGFIYIE